ncbi:MAG: SMC family ATPase [Zestosphaera sp.]
MIIRSVKLTNILSHENSEITFPDGIVAIVGPNGAGKSSIIESIYAALFTEANVDIRGHRKEFLVMRGERKGEIEVSLEVGGIKYLVTREVSIDTPAQASLYILEKNGKKIRSSGPSNVASELGKILGLPAMSTKDLRNMVRSTIISLQDELTKIIDITDSERREWILSLLGLSYLEKSLEVAKKFLNRKDELEGMLRSEENELKRKKDELRQRESRKSSLNKELFDLELKKSKLNEKYSDINKKVKLIEEAIELVDKLGPLIIINRIKELEELKSALEVVEGLNVDEYLRVNEEYHEKMEKLKSYRDQITAILQDVSSKLEMRVDSYEALDNLLKEFRAEKDKLSSSISRNEALKELYTLYVSKFESTSRCPICGSSITDPTIIRDSLTQELNRLCDEIKKSRAELNSIEKKIGIAQESLRDLEKVINSAKHLEEEVSEIRDKLSNLGEKVLELCKNLSESFRGISNNSINECTTYLTSQKDELYKTESELKILNDLKTSLVEGFSGQDIQVLQSRLGEILAEISIAKPSIDLDVPKRWKDIDALRSELNKVSKEWNSELNKIKEEIDKNEDSITTTRTRLNAEDEEIKKVEKEIKDAEERKTELENQIKAYSIIQVFFSKYLGKSGLIAKELTKIARDELERRTNKILGKLGLMPIEIDDEFQIRVKVLGSTLPISNASGGERVGIAIALKLALAELIIGRSPTTLILDEPTIYLDDERRRQIFEIIKELGKSLKQVIVVTHDESVMNIANKVIKVENVGGVSRVSS